MFGTEFEKEGYQHSTTSSVLYQEKSPFLSLWGPSIHRSVRPQQPSSQKNWMRNKKSYFCDYKKRAELYNNWIACKYIWQKKILKILKMTFMVELTAQKNRQESQKLILIFWHSRWHWVLKRSFFSVYPHLPFLLNKSLKVKKWYESSL